MKQYTKLSASAVALPKNELKGSTVLVLTILDSDYGLLSSEIGWPYFPPNPCFTAFYNNPGLKYLSNSILTLKVLWLSQSDDMHFCGRGLQLHSSDDAARITM